MPAILDLKQSLTDRRAELSARLAALERQIAGLSPEDDDGWPDAPRSPRASILRQAAEAVANGGDVSVMPDITRLKQEAAVLRESIAILDERIAAADLDVLAGEVPALNEALRQQVKAWSKWLGSMPTNQAAIRMALDDLHGAHTDTSLLGSKAKGHVSGRPVFDVDLEHVAVSLLDLAERVDAIRKECHEARL